MSDLEKAGVDEKKKQSASRYEIDMAFLDWNERKRKQAEDRRMASDDVLHCPKGLTLEEVLRACKFVTAEIEPQAQTLVKQLVKEMPRSRFMTYALQGRARAANSLRPFGATRAPLLL